MPHTHKKKLVNAMNQDLLQAIKKADLNSALDCVKRLSEKERHQQMNALEVLTSWMGEANWRDETHPQEWNGKATDEQLLVLKAAILACGHPEDEFNLVMLSWLFRKTSLTYSELQSWGKIFNLDIEKWRKKIVAKLEAYQREQFFIDYVIIHGFITGGLIASPDYDAYLLNLIEITRSDFRNLPNGIMTLIEEDKNLPSVFLKLFDLEGTADRNLTSCDKYLRDKNNAWAHIFLTLCEQGIYTRSLLLDKTLTTLERDWPQFRSGWFSRFHELLSPTTEEMSIHAQRYLGLCQSRIPPTVTLALASLTRLYEAKVIEGHELLQALEPVFYSSIKAQINNALKLLERVVKDHPELKSQAEEIALNGLTHEAPDIQQKILDRLQKWGLSDNAKSRLAELSGSIASIHRPTVENFLGENLFAQDIPSATTVAVETYVQNPPLPVLHPSRELTIIDDIDELLEKIAFLLERPSDIDLMEQVMASLWPIAPFDETLRKRFSPITKRAKKIADKDGMAGSFTRLLVFVATGEKLPQQKFHPSGFTVAQLFDQRINRLMANMAKYKTLEPLDQPTHQRGFIDPERLIDRIDLHQKAKQTATKDEQIQALLRLAPTTDSTLLKKAQKLEECPLVLALRHALGDDVKLGKEKELFIAAARIRHPDADDPKVLAAYGDLGPDGAKAAQYSWTVNPRHSEEYTFYHFTIKTKPEFSKVSQDLLGISRHEFLYSLTSEQVCYAARILPSSLEAFFANACEEVGSNLSWWQARWYYKEFVSLLLDPTVPMSPMASLLLALTLAEKEPGLSALGVDALVAVCEDKRLNLDAMGEVLQQLFSMPLISAKRYQKSLKAAADRAPQMPPIIFRLLSQMVCIKEGADIPKDYGALLELLQELMLANHLVLPETTKNALQRMKLSAKAEKIRKELLK